MRKSKSDDARRHAVMVVADRFTRLKDDVHIQPAELAKAAALSALVACGLSAEANAAAARPLTDGDVLAALGLLVAKRAAKVGNAAALELMRIAGTVS